MWSTIVWEPQTYEFRKNFQWNKLTLWFVSKYVSLKSVWKVRGTWVVQSVKDPTHGFSSGYGLMGCGIKPRVRLHAQWGVCLGFSLSASVPPPTYTHFLSLKEIIFLKNQYAKLCLPLILFDISLLLFCMAKLKAKLFVIM